MNIFAENAMLELSYLKSLHLKSTKQKRLFLSLKWWWNVLLFCSYGNCDGGWTKKLGQTELLNTRAIQTKKHLNVFQQWKKKGGKIMENDMILTDLEQDKIVPFKHKVHPS